MTLPGWTREPLVHFFVGGAMLFAFFAWRGEEPDPASRIIEVSRVDQAQLALRFQSMMRRPPTDAELDGLIEQYVHEEVLYREALRLGLDSDDPIVRRRLAQKMDELAGATAETAAVSDDVLRRWLHDHPERFAQEQSYSFDQLWFENRNAAEAALAKLRGGADWRSFDNQLDLPASVEHKAASDVSNGFGMAFLDALAGIDADGTWSAPIQSGFGWHLVRLREKQLGKVPPFAEIARLVENDWRSATIKDRRERAFEVLRNAYRIEIDR